MDRNSDARRFSMSAIAACTAATCPACSATLSPWRCSTVARRSSLR
ncbi:hypothetical protein [Pseudonocardia sp. ICBG601]|nr:hypothetical protein [Pseudonocardia sp. ICBG601]